MTGQRKGAAIAMTDAERDAFLRAQPVGRVAGGSPRGVPEASRKQGVDAVAWV